MPEKKYEANSADELKKPRRKAFWKNATVTVNFTSSVLFYLSYWSLSVVFGCRSVEQVHGLAGCREQSNSTIITVMAKSVCCGRYTLVTLLSNIKVVNTFRLILHNGIIIL